MTSPKLEIISRKPVSPKDTPLLFIHGMWHAAWCWEENFLNFFAEKGFESYALSLRGHGKSEGKEKLRFSSISDYVNDVETAIKLIGKEPILIGHSMGGYIVQKYLEKKNLKAAVLLAPVPHFGISAVTLRTLKERPLTFLKILSTLKLFPVLEKFEECRKFLFSDNLEIEKAKKYCAKMHDEAFRAYLDMFLPIKTKSINAPILIMGAENDKAVLKKEIFATAKKLNAEAYILKNTAHDIMLENSWREAAAKIADWLEKRGVK